jgi:2-polyprenyl-6-methoxyphenol hydroxylase-like FAD-dependent oxidoreductase
MLSSTRGNLPVSEVREHIGMRGLLGQRAVVVGAGVGGLSMAGALANCFEQVEILERDRLTASIGSRSGTPQDRHPHALLAGGLRALDEIFPGFADDLAGAGAVSVRVAQDIQFERPDVGLVPKRDFGISLLCASRPLIEFVLRGRAETIRNISLRPQCRVTEIVPAETNDAVQGVRIDIGSGRSEKIAADLVVDASGRGALTFALLDAVDWQRPEVTEVGVDISYVSAVVEIPPDPPPEWKLAVTFPDPPHLALSAVLLPIEGSRWMVLVANRHATERPQTWESFLESCRSLITPTIYDALRPAKPRDDIRYYGFPASLWRHFEGLPRLPSGLLPVADALCRFNPVYGQGMSVAAKQARLLQDVSRRAAAEPDPIVALQAGFMAEVASVLETPWSMSTGPDLAFPSTRGGRPDKFEESQQFEAALFRAVVVDPVVHRALTEVGQLLQPNSLLQTPDIMRRIEAVSAAKPA